MKATTIDPLVSLGQFNGSTDSDVNVILQKLDQMEQRMKIPKPIRVGSNSTINIEYMWLQPFIDEIINSLTFDGFHMPKGNLYEAFTDLANHL